VPACLFCNLSKHDLLLTEWMPNKVALGVATDQKVAAEWARLGSAQAVPPRTIKSQQRRHVVPAAKIQAASVRSSSA
jgi:hypothetical protein